MAETLKKFQGNGFVIENCIIKGDKKRHDVRKNNFGEFFFDLLSETPEHIGQIDALTGNKRTFGDIKERCTRLAVWLKNIVKPGDVVSICAPRHMDAEIIFRATAFIGAIYVPIAHILDLATAKHCIHTARPRVIFMDESVIDILQEASALEHHEWEIVIIGNKKNRKYKSFDDVLNLSSSAEINEFQVVKTNPENICAMFHTSGTTGLPKFVPLSHQNFIDQVLQCDLGDKSKQTNDILLAYFYPGWIVNMLISTKALLLRQTLIFHKDFEPHESCKIIEKYKVNTLIWEVYMISLLARSDVLNKYDLQSVTYLHSVGSKLFNEVRVKMLNIFPNLDFVGRGLGITETGTITLFTKECRNPHSEGTVLPNAQLKIVDTRTGLPLEHSKRGELCTKSPGMMSGYYKDPTATKLAFDYEGWFRTGDEAYYDENGEIVVVGRLKEVIKYRDAYLQPLCIEHTLLSHPNIIDAAVVGIFHDVEIEQPVAYVQIAQGSHVTEKDILELTNDLEYSDVFKDWIIFTDKIPRNTNGKINKRLLTEHAENIYKSRSRKEKLREHC